MFEKVLLKYCNTFQLAIMNVNSGNIKKKTCNIIISSLIKDEIKDMNHVNSTVVPQRNMLYCYGPMDLKVN